MAEEILCATLNGKIPMQDVLNWISNKTPDLLNNKVHCSRGDFVLSLLNFLRHSTSRVWQQSSFAQSPKKAISKSTHVLSKNSLPSGKVHSGRQYSRRVELFPSQSPSSRTTPCPNVSRQDNESTQDIFHVSGSKSTSTLSPTPQKEAVTLSSSKNESKDEGNPFLDNGVTLPVTSSPLPLTINSDGSPNVTPMNKRIYSCKSSERRSPPVLLNSPDHNYKTPPRNNGVCLGDFIVKGGKCSRMQTKKRFSLSPPRSPLECKSNTPVDQLNSQSSKKKHRRRINPTKVSAEVLPSSPQTGFTETHPFGSASRSISDTSAFQSPVNEEPLRASQSFSEERNLLRQERLKLQNQGEQMSLQVTSVNPTVPPKSVVLKMLAIPDPLKVSDKEQLLRLCDMYCCVLNSNLVPNLMTELYFVISLLVARYDSKLGESDCMNNLGKSLNNIVLEQGDEESHEVISNSGKGSLSTPDKVLVMKKTSSQFFDSAHNCVFFASHVLLNQIGVLRNFDRITLKLLLESERIALFSPELKECLSSLYSSTSSKIRVSQGSVTASFKAVVNGNVSFQSDTDNCSNFPSAQCFSNFRKQRDGFYELIRIWEANHQKQDWSFATTLGNRVRSLLLLCNDPINLMHFARLFRLQLISVVSGGPYHSEEGPQDLQFLKGLRGIDPDKLNRLCGRINTPYKSGGPRPSPSFPGHQEFYHDFILSSAHSYFMQHLQDSLISHLLELDQTTFAASDTEDSDLSVDATTRQGYISCVSTMRLLAKFLGLVVFLPYNRPDTNLPQNILETEISVRSKVMPPLNVLKCVLDAYKAHRLVVTIPWIVKFLGMMDRVSCSLPAYQTVLQFLLRLYVDLKQGGLENIASETCVLPSQSILLLRLSLGWLFEAPFIQESIFYSWCFNLDCIPLLSLDAGGIDYSLLTLDSSDVTSLSTSSLPLVDALNIIDCEAMYALCPFLLELRALLTSTSTSECTPNGSVRHITPVSAAPSLQPSTSSGKQLELKLEESFFHGLPSSVHRTVDFVVERVTSSCVKHICNVWLPGLKQKGISTLQEKIKTYLSNTEEDTNPSSSIQESLKKEISMIVEQVSVDLKSKCRSGVGDFCVSKCQGALSSLLPEESLSLPVLEMCIGIASRSSEERVISWIQNHATLSLYCKDLQSESEKALTNRDRGEAIIIAKTSHIAPGETASWDHEDSAPSPSSMLQNLKLLVSDILNGKNITREHVLEVLNDMELCVTKRQDVIPAAERILALLSVDLVVSLVCHNPCLVDSPVLCRLVSLWKLNALRPVEDGLARLVCPRNMLLLAQSNHPARLVWEKLAEVVVAVLKAKLVTPDLVENQCLAIMQQEWPQNILRSFAMCMNEVIRQYQKQRDVDYKFVLLLEWLAETMAQIDYFPHL